MYYSTNARYSSLSTCCSYQRHKLAKPVNLPKIDDLSKIEEHWIEKYFHFLNKCN
jgi:predicted AAA+ superfamily ATPase